MYNSDEHLRAVSNGNRGSKEDRNAPAIMTDEMDVAVVAPWFASTETGTVDQASLYLDAVDIDAQRRRRGVQAVQATVEINGERIAA